MANLQSIEGNDRISDGCPVFCTAEIPAEVRAMQGESCRSSQLIGLTDSNAVLRRSTWGTRAG